MFVPPVSGALDPVHCIRATLCYDLVAARYGRRGTDLHRAGYHWICCDWIMSILRLTHFTDPHLYGSETESLRGVATLPALGSGQ